MYVGPARTLCAAATTEDTSTAEPTGPERGAVPAGTGGWERAFARLGHGGQTAARRVSLRDGGRHHLLIRLIGTEAQTDGQPVTQDGDATQHQGFRMRDDHCRPPATYGKDFQEPAPTGAGPTEPQ